MNKTNILLKEYITDIKPYVPTSDENKKIARDFKGYLVGKLLRKEFRRRKVSDKLLSQIVSKVDLSIKKDIPIHLTIPFGGYKHFWNSSHPETDWAELFTFRYLTDLVLPIIAAYKPGVLIEFISEDLILTRMNNYPKDSLEKYAKSFEQIIKWYSKLVPNNLKFSYFRVGDKFDKNIIVKNVEDLLPERKIAFDKLTAEQKEIETHRSNRAIMWNGEIDLTKLSDTEKEQRVSESRIIELAYYDTEGREEYLGTYFWDDNHICINFSFGLSPDNVFDDLTLGTSNGSIVDFWIGRGVINDANGNLVPTIVSNNQYLKVKDSMVVENIDFVPLPLKNYKSIDILKKSGN